MQVLNDRKTEAPEEGGVSFLSVFGQAILVAFGLSTIVLGPLPMIQAQHRMPDTLAKLASLAGAVLAFVFLRVPIAVVVPLFVVGLTLSDGIRRGDKFWTVNRTCLMLGLSCFVGGLLFSSQFAGRTPIDQWFFLVDKFTAEFQETAKTSWVAGRIDWEDLRMQMRSLGGLFYIASLLSLTLWLSSGFAAHLGWPAAEGPWSSKGLQSLSLPRWSIVVFVGAFLAQIYTPPHQAIWMSGALNLMGTVFFAQGCIALSRRFHSWGIPPRGRTLLYGFLMVFGFFAVVLVGAVAPLTLGKRRFLEERR